MYCPNCGNIIDIDDKFCGYCGFNLQKINNKKANDVVNIYKKRFNNKLYKKILMCVIILSFFIVLFFVIAKNTSRILDVDMSNKIINSNDTTTNVEDDSNILPTIAAPTSTPISTLQPTSTPKESMYLFDSDKQYITKEFLDSKTKDEIRLMLNEMYARHGYIFNLNEYKTYFNKQSWYTSKYTSEFEAESHFNEIEKENKKIIVNYEKAKGWR